MRRPILALLGVVGALAAFPAAAQDQVTWREAEACLSDADTPICWLRLAARTDDGASLRRDPELRDRPQLLALAGVSPAPEPAPETPVVIPDQPGLTLAMNAFTGGLDRFRQAIGLRQDPDHVVDAFSTLPLTGDVAMAHPLQSQVYSVGRLDAYAMAAAVLEHNRDTAPAYFTRVLNAVLTAWERDLASVDKAEIFNGGPDELAGFHARRGANDAARRVLMNGYAEDEPALISALVRLDLLDDAFTVAEGADPSRGVDRLRREEAAAMALMERQMAPYRQAALDQILSEFPEEERATMQRQMEAELAAQGEAWAPPAPVDFLREAEDDLASARTQLLHASVEAGRTDLAAPIARRMMALALEAPDARGDDYSLGQALTAVVEAEGEAATGLVEQMADHARQRRGVALQSLLPAIHDAWIKLDRPDRAEALIDEWRPIAIAQDAAFRTGEDPAGVLGERGQPDALQGLQNLLVARSDFEGAEALGWLPPHTALEADIRAGRGGSFIEERLAGRTAADQSQILLHCRGLALERDDLDLAADCGLRHARVADRMASRAVAADGLLRVAERAAGHDDAELAFRLTREALPLGAAAEEERADIDPYLFPVPNVLPHIAKAMLRQDGRLPPRAADD